MPITIKSFIGVWKREYNKPLRMPNPSTNPQTCPNCQRHFDPLPERRGHAQVYCSPRCRRAAAKRRAAHPVGPAPRPPVAPAPRTAPAPSPVRSLEPQDGPTPEWVYDVSDDLCRANWDALRWRRRYELVREAYDRDMSHVVGILERIVNR